MSADGGLDSINRPTWSRTAAEFAEHDSWIDRGERNAITLVAPRVRGGRLLDVGVGAGRTAWLLPLLSDDYVAIDYTPEMVSAARSRHPRLDIRVGDARDLSDFPAASRDLVMFSWNGVDALDHDDRHRALLEFRRVLAPGGTLLLSTLNKDGPAYGEAPTPFRGLRGGRLGRAVRFAYRARTEVPRYRRERSNWRRHSPAIEDHGAWGIAPLAAHDFGLLVHYVTLAEARRELEAHGFVVDTVFADSGAELPSTTTSTTDLYFHLVATAS